jgi:SAM-dependent methyltransferase
VAVVAALREAADTRRAFDAVAASYDASNQANALLCAMRDRTRAALCAAAVAGSRILNLGCGPGTDDVFLARRGYLVTAVDSSPAMIAQARRRVREEGCDRSVRAVHLDLDDIGALHPALFDAAYSSFGPLNCVPDLGATARAIHQRLRPQGVLVASVIGRWCPWEIALYAARRDWRRAAVRLSGDAVAVPLEGRQVWTRYYSPREFVDII